MGRQKGFQQMHMGILPPRRRVLAVFPIAAAGLMAQAGNHVD